MTRDTAARKAYRVATPVARVAGASVSALLIRGEWPERAVAFVATPVFAPFVHVAVIRLYRQRCVDPSQLPCARVSGLTGCLLAFAGLEICVWFIARLKSVFTLLRPRHPIPATPEGT